MLFGNTEAFVVRGRAVSDAVDLLTRVIARSAAAKQAPATERQYSVYILTNRHHTVLSTGVTNNLCRRVFEHREKLIPGFTSRYNVDKLVFFQGLGDVLAAIAREKQIKGGSRAKKLALIAAMNPAWRDLYEGPA
jgi:putative endonuclease